ncbi:hypothetical protein ACTI_05750 [Actinoplanes sp. OR16]|nr:hypothetical protein ACTI_05750 [Actinoplanes sp. OR16]
MTTVLLTVFFPTYGVRSSAGPSSERAADAHKRATLCSVPASGTTRVSAAIEGCKAAAAHSSEEAMKTASKAEGSASK